MTGQTQDRLSHARARLFDLECSCDDFNRNPDRRAERVAWRQIERECLLELKQRHAEKED